MVGNHRDRFCALYFLRCAVAGNRRTLCVLSCRYCVAGNHHTNFSSNLNLYSCDRSIESPLLFSKPPVDVIHFIRVCNWQHSGASTGKSPRLGSTAITHLVIHQENPRRISLSSTISLRPVFPDIRRSADRVYPVFHIWFHSSTGFVQHSKSPRRITNCSHLSEKDPRGRFVGFAVCAHV